MANVSNEVVNDVKGKVRHFIVQNFLFGNESIEFSDNDSFMEKGIIDSTGILELIGYLEENFGIEIADDELVPENLDSVDNVGRFVLTKQEL